MTPAAGRRWLLSAIVGLLGLAATGAYVWFGIAPAQVHAASPGFRLAATPDGPIAAPPLPPGALRTALLVAPLEQSIVNVAMVTAIARQPSIDAAPWLRTLSGVGWRDTTSLQNVIAAAVRREDVGAVVDSADALLRMKEIEPEATQVMNLAEAYPATWPRVFGLLRANVGWREDYLARAATMTAPEVLDGRARTLAALEKAGVSLKESSVRPFVGALLANARFAQADELWRHFTGDQGNAVHDPFFKRALGAGTEVTPLAFEWVLNADTGYVADIASNGLEGAIVTLQWDGRGVPVFLAQQVSAGPGAYVAKVRVDGDTRSFANRIGFRLRCDKDVTLLNPVNEIGKVELTLATEKVVPCTFPVLEVFGRVQNVARAFDGTLSAISLVPLRSTIAPGAGAPTR